jgi:hypothetical protein
MPSFIESPKVRIFMEKGELVETIWEFVGELSIWTTYWNTANEPKHIQFIDNKQLTKRRNPRDGDSVLALVLLTQCWDRVEIRAIGGLSQ